MVVLLQLTRFCLVVVVLGATVLGGLFGHVIGDNVMELYGRFPSAYTVVGALGMVGLVAGAVFGLGLAVNDVVGVWAATADKWSLYRRIGRFTFEVSWGVGLFGVIVGFLLAIWSSPLVMGGLRSGQLTTHVWVKVVILATMAVACGACVWGLLAPLRELLDSRVYRLTVRPADMDCLQLPVDHLPVLPELPLADETRDTLVELAARGQRVEAIKLIVSEAGCRFVDAQKYIDVLEKRVRQNANR